MERLIVTPNLTSVVEMAREAQVQIIDLAFVNHPPPEHDPICKWLVALNIDVQGTHEALGYFAFLLKQRQLTTV